MNAVFKVAVVVLLAGLLLVQVAILNRMPANLGDIEAAQAGTQEQANAAVKRTAIVKVYGSVGVSAVDPVPVQIEPR